MAAEPTTRFAHLLQPLRDLSKVWNIEIADELEKYTEEVARLLVLNPEDGITQLNFAEAALLIQGSTAIYSRKVELLYQLVYQALDMLSLDKKDGTQSKKNKVVQSGLWAPIPDTDELLTIDHLIKEGRNITLDSGAPEQRQALQRRVPLFLMPRDQSDRKSKDFRISSCTVHHTGVYLLQESDARLLDELLSTDDLDQSQQHFAPLVPAPPREVQDLDDRLQELLRGIPAPVESLGVLGGSPEAAGNVSPRPLEIEMSRAGLGAPALSGRSFAAVSDPWALLDEHQAFGHEQPLEVGNTSKRVMGAQKLLMNAEGLPDVGSSNLMSDSDLWSASNRAADLAPLLAAGHPVEALFLAVAGRLKGGRYEALRAHFSAAWLDFEDLFNAALSKRRGQKMSSQAKVGAAPGTPGAEGDAASDDEGCGGPCPSTPPQFALVLDPTTPGSEEKQRRADQRREVAMLENMIQDAQQKYELTIRQHLQNMQKDAPDMDSRKFPQLYANVRRWQDQLEPVLKEFESRPEFDIHGYTAKFLKKLTSLQSGENSEVMVPFARLVHAQPRWEVCRRFLTCLLLTNEGNTDIVFDADEERLNEFKVKLLKAERQLICLEGGAAEQMPAKANRIRKAVSQNVLADSSDAKKEPAFVHKRLKKVAHG